LPSGGYLVGMPTLTTTRGPSHAFAATLALLTLLAAPAALADDLDDQGLPVVRNRAGYALAVTEYSTATDASFQNNEPAEHTLSLEALVRPEEDADVLCFATTLVATSARGDRRKELLLPGRAERGKEFKAVLPMPAYKTRRGEPIALSAAELSKVELSRPAYEVRTLTCEIDAVLVERRDSETVPAIVADRYIELGHDTRVKVAAMEVNNKGIMTIKMNVKRPPGRRGAVVDSVYALDDDGDAVGGGRWQNELDLFADAYDVELEFPLEGKPTIPSLRIVLATEYEVKPVRFEIEGLFQQ